MGLSPLERTSTTMAQRQHTVLPGTSQTQSNAEWSFDARNGNCVREYKDILHRYSYKYSLQECDIWTLKNGDFIQFQTATAWHRLQGSTTINLTRAGTLHGALVSTPPEKRQTILQHFCTNQTSARVEQNTGKQMDFIAIIYWDKTCCHPDFTRSNQIEVTLMAGEKMYILVSCTSTWAPKVPTTFSDRVSCWKKKKEIPMRTD